MNILRILFELFVLYIVYKLITDFIIPVYRATRQMKDAVHKAQEQMKNQQFNKTNGTTHPAEPQVKKDFDYIDYEEVK